MQSEYRNRSVLEIIYSFNEIRAMKLDFIKKLFDLAAKAVEVVFFSILFCVLLSNICTVIVVFTRYCDGQRLSCCVCVRRATANVLHSGI